MDGQLVDLRRHVRMLQQGGQFGRKGDTPAEASVIKRLFPEPVTREKQPASRAIEYAKREHPVEAIAQLDAPFLVAMDQHFGIGMAGSEAVPPLLENRAELGVIVDFAVEDDRDRTVLIVHRLLAARDVQNRKPTMPEADAVFSAMKETVAVRAAMGQSVGHRMKPHCIFPAGEADDSAHYVSPSMLSVLRTR